MISLASIPKVIITSDGSPTLWVKHLDETYHSRHGAIRESQHVFITNGLLKIAQRKGVVNIFEVGLGTGLNALLSWEAAEKHSLKLHYTAIELFPLDTPIVESLRFETGSLHAENNLKLIHLAGWDTASKLNENFILEKINADLLSFAPATEHFDVIYFDAFGPKVQPEMWSKEIFETMFVSLKPEGVLVTYCAKGQVRRDLQSVGFSVERLDGPPGKREMLRATKLK